MKILYYAFHKDITDMDNLIPAKLKNRVLECKVVEENGHHWTLLYEPDNLKFTVVKYPAKQRNKNIPPFDKPKKAQEYLQYAIPTFDKDGERM